MSCLQLDKVQQRTFHEIGIHDPHPSVRQRVQALLLLARDVTLAAVAVTFSVHLNSIENWARWWDAIRQQTLGELPQQCKCTVRHLLGTLRAGEISDSAEHRYLHDQGLRYKRCCYSAKKSQCICVPPRQSRPLMT